MLWRAFRYTGRGELAGVSDALRGEVHYGYDAEGRLLQHRELQSGRTGSRLVYDAADNLLGGQSPHDDPERPPPPPQSSNRLPHWQRLFYRYDVWGNLVSRRHGLNEQHYTYDADNRLIRARGSGPQGEFSAQYHYDALGRRSRKEVTFAGKAPQTTRFLWQGYRLLQEQRANGTRRTWSYDPESPWTPLAAIEQAGEGPQADIYWLNTDLNGAPLEVTDADGRLRWSGQYDTFGRLQGQTTAGAAQRTGPVYDQPLRYAGQYADSETGLHYNLFRYYEPDVGRFTTQDPVGLAGGLNLYAYAPNPYGWVDPLGLAKCGNNEKSSYKGPELPGSIAETFDKGIYKNRQLYKSETFYKYHGLNNRTGRKYSWLTNERYGSEEMLRQKLAIRHDWGVVITKVSEFKVPQGTWISEGPAAAQGAGYPGLGYQAVVSNLPKSWIINTLKVPW